MRFAHPGGAGFFGFAFRMTGVKRRRSVLILPYKIRGLTCPVDQVSHYASSIGSFASGSRSGMTALSRLLAKPKPRTAVSTFFAVVGFISAGWIARIPALTGKLDLDTAQLGSLLLFIAIGSLLAFQFIGRLIERYGSDRTTYLFSLGYIAALVLMAVSPHPSSLAAALFVYGFGFGATDVAMNAQGVT